MTSVVAAGLAFKRSWGINSPSAVIPYVLSSMRCKASSTERRRSVKAGSLAGGGFYEHYWKMS